MARARALRHNDTGSTAYGAWGLDIGPRPAIRNMPACIAAPALGMILASALQPPHLLARRDGTRAHCALRGRNF
eukprot:8932535-Pyramimonas_sp.AAC.1